MNRRALLLQITEPGAYPPIVNVSKHLAEAGWYVTILSAPTRFLTLRVPHHDRITVHTVRERKMQAIDKFTYAQYFAKALTLAGSTKPRIVYASNPTAAGPGIAASLISGADLFYHEHDSPEPDSASWLNRARAVCARFADTVIFPNSHRAQIATTALELPSERVQIVWNVPRLAELPRLNPASSDRPLVLYYHGNLSPVLLPEAVLVALQRFEGRVILRIVGYESPSAKGYLTRLQRMGKDVIRYEGQISRDSLLQSAASAHVGLAFSPRHPKNLNECYLVGASNKPFDYMAAGLALLVSNDAPSHDTFVSRGLARECDTSDPDAIAAAISWFLEYKEARLSIAARGRALIEDRWNFDTEFESVMKRINQLT